MSVALSSWKEIAAYLGKGVRTVQRWEQQFGLPVRRPNAKSHVIFAIPTELDAWIKSHQHAPNNHPVKAIATNQKQITQQHRLLQRLKTSYTRLEKNQQVLRRSVDRLLSTFQTRARSPRSGKAGNGNDGQQTRSTTAA